MIANHHYRQMKISAFQTAKKGQPCCGDSYFFEETNDYFICALADGLGSGVKAKEASERAISVVRENHNEGMETLMKACNKELGASRGAVLSMFKILFDARKLIFSGVGNVRFIFYPPNEKPVYSIPEVGFLSGRALVPKVQTFPFKKGSSFVIYSDGLELNAGSRAAFSDMTPPEEASRVAQKLAVEGANLKDDVTFLFGKNVWEMR